MGVDVQPTSFHSRTSMPRMMGGYTAVGYLYLALRNRDAIDDECIIGIATTVLYA